MKRKRLVLKQRWLLCFKSPRIQGRTCRYRLYLVMLFFFFFLFERSHHNERKCVFHTSDVEEKLKMHVVTAVHWCSVVHSYIQTIADSLKLENVSVYPPRCPQAPSSPTKPLTIYRDCEHFIWIFVCCL